MRILKQSSTAQPLMFLMIDSSDHISAKTGLSPTVTLSKSGGSFASPAGAVTEVANGWYKVAGNATDTGTLGPLILHATGTAADPVDIEYEVVAVDPQSATAFVTGVNSLAPPTNWNLESIDGSGVVKANLAQILGTALTETAGLLAGGFKKFFNIATPAATMDHGVLVDTITTYTGNTLQTVDAATINTKIGTPAASVSADVAAVKVDTAAVKVVTDQLVATQAEPGQGAPAVNASPLTKIAWLFKAFRNRKTQTSSQFSLYADDATTVDAKAAVSDDGSTTAIGEIASGP